MSTEEARPDEEAQIAAALARGDDADWVALWDAVDDLAEETTFARWAGGEVIRTTIVDGEERPVLQMPYPVYADSVQRVRRQLTALQLTVVFDWPRWEGARRYREDRAALADAPVGDALRLLTAIQRSERFGDGNIEGALTNGVMQAALARLRHWYDTERGPGPPAGAG